jgi:predicted DNA-binding protein
MAERFHRTQILLEPEQHRILTERARREGRSLSDLVREMVDLQLRQGEDDLLARRLDALERIRQHREAMLARRGGQPIQIDAAELVNEVREEQDERNLTGLT